MRTPSLNKWVGARLAAPLLLGLVLLAATPETQDQNPSQLKLEPAPSSTVAPIPVQSPAPAGPAGPVRVSSSLDKAIITVGDLITYTLEVEAPADSQVAMPQPGAELGGFIIRDYTPPEKKKLDRTVIVKMTYQITAYATGTLEIPPLPVIVKAPGGLVTGLWAEGVQVRVAPVSNPDDLEIRDVKPPVLIPINWRPYYLFGGIALGLVILAAGALLSLYRWRPRPEELPAPVKPAHELFYEEMQALLALKLLEAGEVEAFYTKLSEIARRYLALRYRIYALEYTTTEILDRLRDKSLEMRAFSRIQWLLEETDLVKFAQHLPAEGERKEIAGKAEELVDWTREADLLPMGAADAPPPAPEMRASA
jgi:hypothetical protein